ncbi:MAG TPA: hypothetical protein VFQ21_03920 [Gemmatimonadota bacterium]|nr:hypothetical protein [Gemmatimonadota bacterium]
MIAGLPSRRRLLIAISLATVACREAGGPAESAVQATYEEPFDLSLDERASVGGEFRVTFDRVTEDSRCASRAECAPPGNAAVVLKIDGEEGTATLTLHTGREPRRAAAAGHALELVELRPARSPDSPPDPEDYEVTLLVAPLP